MAQAQLPFDNLAPAAGRAADAESATAPGQRRAPAGDTELDRIGFAIGWDHAHHRLTPPVEHLHADNPVRQGWSAGRAAFGARTLRAGTAVRQWLALRLRAWQHGDAFEGVQVTPHFLAQLETATCPVTREALSPPTGAAATSAGARPDAAIVDRISLQAAYAGGNLAVLSARAHSARHGRDWSEALAQAGRIEAGEALEVDGLDAAQWTRLGVLASFGTPLPHGLAATLPLRVLPPNRVRVQNPVQALQVMLTLQFTQSGYARRLLALAALMPCGETRQAFQIFMHTLLARRLAAGSMTDAPGGAGTTTSPARSTAAWRQAMEDSWADPLVNRRWQRLASRLDAEGCERLLQAAARRGLVGRACHWLAREAATDGWALDSAGRQPAAAAATPEPQAAERSSSEPRSMPAPALPAGSRSPGSERNRGSQKLAS
jgi:hypothetical protein